MKAIERKRERERDFLTFNYVHNALGYHSECKLGSMADLSQLHHSLHRSLMKRFHGNASQGNFLSLDTLSIYRLNKD